MQDVQDSVPMRDDVLELVPERKEEGRSIGRGET